MLYLFVCFILLLSILIFNPDFIKQERKKKYEKLEKKSNRENNNVILNQVKRNKDFMEE